MNDCDTLLKRVIDQARALGIPVSREIDGHVRVNGRAVARFGCCKYEKGGQVIEVAGRVARGPERSCMETLAHEVLHTCPGCRNHGERWKDYARRMNQAYGYHITRTSTDKELGVEERPCKYLLRCDRCGTEFKRFRASPLTRHPERYRCRCGGRLERAEIQEDEGENTLGRKELQM